MNIWQTAPQEPPMTREKAAYEQDAAFVAVIEHTLDFEGGYVNDIDDPGGETNFGISKRSYPHLDIKNLTRDQAKEIYHDDFWRTINLHKVARHLPNVAAKVFDISVHNGVRNGGRFLQRALNKYKPQTRPTLTVDGIIGQQTLQACAVFDKAKEPLLVKSLVNQQRRRYLWIIAGRSKSAKFRNGWLKRAAYKPDITIKTRDYA